MTHPAAMGSFPGAGPELSALMTALHNVTGGPGPKRGPGGWMVRCPAHDDREASLSVTDKPLEQLLLVNCFGHCPPEAVVRAIGWEMKDLFYGEKTAHPYAPAPSRSSQRATPPAPTYAPLPLPRVLTVEEAREANKSCAHAPEPFFVYEDEDGRPLFRVTRKPNKKFIQQQWQGKQYAPRLGDARRVLYRLPEILTAIRAGGATVFLVEGEKDVHTLVEDFGGLAATTCAMGAGGWRDEYADALIGAARVVVMPDNDESGMAFATDVEASLDARGIPHARVFFPHLPVKADVTDWKEMDGGTREKLFALVDEAFEVQAPIYTQRVTTLSDFEADGPPPVGDALWTPMLRQAVDLFHGVSEADPVGIAAHLLVGFGAMVGGGTYTMWGDTRVTPKTFCLIIGESGKGRKGQAWSVAKTLLERADIEFFERKRISTGLTSGEGLINRVHQPRQRGDEPPHDVDPRLLALSTEFAGPLAAAERKGSTLSTTLRQAWDGEALGVDTRSDPLYADNHHICHIGHISPKELRAKLNSIEVANGFANRYLMTWVERSQLLPRPARVDEAARNRVGATLRGSLMQARDLGYVPLSPAALDRWSDLYTDVESRERPGMAGELTARAAAHMMRLSLIIALIESSQTVEVTHLEAAFALWNHADQTITRIFGNRIGDPHAERLLIALGEAGAAGLDGVQRYNVFDRNLKKDAMAKTVDLLVRHGLAVLVVEKPEGGRGRPREILVAREHLS